MVQGKNGEWYFPGSLWLRDGEVVGKPRELSRTITKDELLRDGTPRSEKGWRAYVMMATGKFVAKWGKEGRCVHRSPLFDTQDAALAWKPE